MNKSLNQDPDIANELSQHRFAPPSLDLQDRILRAAQQSMKAKEAEPDDMSWKAPVLRFAASLVLAVLIIIAGNMEGDSVITQQQSSPASMPASIAGPADTPLIIRLAVSDPARSERIGREQVSNYRRQVQELAARNP